MKDEDKTKAELIKELKTLRKEQEKGVFKDIAEHIQVEKELKDSEERLKILFDYAPDAYYISDLKGNFIDGNKEAEKLIGYKKEELIGKNFLKLKLLSLADIPKAAKLLAKNFRRLPTGPDEFVLNRKDSSKVTVEISTYPVKIKGRALALGIARDITERKQAEDELRESEEKIRAILDASPDVIHLLDINGIILSTNEGFAKRLGLEIDDLVGKCVFDYTSYESIHQRKAAIKTVFRTGEPLQLEDKGLSGVFESHIHPVFNPAGEVTAVAIYARDITERKQAEERLKKTMNATIDTMSNMIEAKDPYTSGHQHRVCQLAVPLAQELNLPEDRIEGIRIASLIHDIGKIGLPTEILSKPSKLTDIEFGLIKGHSQIGYDILKSIDFSYPIARIVLQHHESINGSGYPNNLKGDEILLEAKIIGVADVVEAISSHRPYRPSLGIDRALEEISQNKGILYDPEVVDVCFKLFKGKDFKFEQ